MLASDVAPVRRKDVSQKEVGQKDVPAKVPRETAARRSPSSTLRNWAAGSILGAEFDKIRTFESLAAPKCLIALGTERGEAIALVVMVQDHYTSPPITSLRAVLVRKPVHNWAKQRIWLVAALLAIASQTGCVRRRMTIRSNPPGAVVYVDERRIGVTPTSTSYTYYGTRNIQVAKDGYETVKEEHRFRAPWYQYFGIDFFAENLWPFETRDERILDFDLPPMQATVPSQVIGRADQLRGEAQRGLMTPMVESQPYQSKTHDRGPGLFSRKP